MDHSIDTYDVKIATTCLLTKVAFADEYLDSQEEKIIREILSDFFSITTEEINKLFANSKDYLKPFEEEWERLISELRLKDEARRAKNKI